MFLDYLPLIIVATLLLLATVLFCVLVPVKVWLKALFSGVPVSARALSSLKLRKIKPEIIVEEYIYAKKAGIDIVLEELATHHISGGNVRRVVDALIATKNVSLELSLDTAKAIDLTGVNVGEIVHESITPKEVSVPEISAFSPDGVEIKATLTLTLKIDLGRFLGGAKENTIISRATEAVICLVSATNSSEILSNPDLLPQFVEARRIDENTAFLLLSVDLVKLEKGRDLVREQEEQDRERQNQLALLAAEEEKALVRLEQERLRVKAEEENLKRAQLETEVPKALLKAFEKGKMEVMDYYKMQNIIADTNMRKALFDQTKEELAKPKSDFDFDADEDFV